MRPDRLVDGGRLVDGHERILECIMKNYEQRPVAVVILVLVLLLMLRSGGCCRQGEGPGYIAGSL